MQKTIPEKTENTTTDVILQLPLEELHAFHDHPYKVMDDACMVQMIESVGTHGVLVPIVVRPLADGGYEIISGHRRKRACELAGIDTIPAIVRDVDDDTAIIMMVDSNVQREDILPSERGKAYRMKLEAMKHQGLRQDLTADRSGTKVKDSLEMLSDQVHESKKQIQRYVRLTWLIPELAELVDKKKIGLTPAVELSFLTPDEQRGFVIAMKTAEAAPTLSQTQRIKKMSREGGVTTMQMTRIMMEPKVPYQDKVTLSSTKLKKYFPTGTSQEEMTATIEKLLTMWATQRLKRQKEKQAEIG